MYITSTNHINLFFPSSVYRPLSLPPSSSPPVLTRQRHHSASCNRVCALQGPHHEHGGVTLPLTLSPPESSPPSTVVMPRPDTPPPHSTNGHVSSTNSHVSSIPVGTETPLEQKTESNSGSTQEPNAGYTKAPTGIYGLMSICVSFLPLSMW